MKPELSSRSPFAGRVVTLVLGQLLWVSKHVLSHCFASPKHSTEFEFDDSFRPDILGSRVAGSPGSVSPNSEKFHSVGPLGCIHRDGPRCWALAIFDARVVIIYLNHKLECHTQKS